MTLENNKQEKIERVGLIMEGLAQGQTREEIAERIGYSTWKSLDIYMRRQGHVWDKLNGIYTIAMPEVPAEENKATYEAGITPEEVVNIFKMGFSDAREVAKRAGFPGHKEMGTYMRSQGYIWSAEDLNYIKKRTTTSGVRPTNNSIENNEVPGRPTNHQETGVYSIDLERYRNLLDFLEKSRNKLIKLLDSSTSSDQVRVYNITGPAKTKSVFLSDSLSELMMTFCKHHNLSQRKGYEAALAEYLSKYGLEEEVEKLLVT